MFPAGSLVAVVGDVFPWQALLSSAAVWQFWKPHVNVCVQLGSQEAEKNSSL